MRRQPLAVLFLLLGIAVGIIVPYAARTLSTAFSSPPSGYTAEIYQDVNGLPFSGQHHEVLDITDIVNTGRAMPRLVVVIPAGRTVTIEAQRDHKVILVHAFLKLGHGMTAFSLCPLAPGQTATIRMWWRSPGTDITPDFGFYGQVPHLVNGYDPRAAIVDIRSLRHTSPA